MARSLKSRAAIKKPPRFVADAMLGRLAKWLRILGYDTVYQPSIEDQTLIRIAREEDRWVLTRDSHLLERRWSPSVRLYLIRSEHLPDQLRQIVAEFRLSVRARLMTRCLQCNGLLIPARPSEVEDTVPAYISVRQKRFMRCPQCGQVYWEGTHEHRIREELNRWFRK